MGKILWIIVVIIVAVALYNTFSQLGGFKFENLSSVIKLPNISDTNIRTTSTIQVPTGAVKNTPPPAVQAPFEPVKPQIVPPPGFSLSQLSPFYSQIKINSVSAGSYGPGQFSLRSDYSLKTPIDITGWHLKSYKGNITIPTAVSDYDPSGIVSKSDILLKSGDYANFYNNTSPILANLRLNKCMGYLDNIYEFDPALPNNCPVPYERSEISVFSGLCQNMILSTYGCSVPTAQQLNNLATYSDQICKTFINDRFSYKGCYQYRHNNPDFFGNEWRIWLNGAINFDQSHDLLLLFDNNGLLVDRYYY
jgi:hypothetical protein